MKKKIRFFFLVLCAVTLLSCEVKKNPEQGAIAPQPKAVEAADRNTVSAPDFSVEGLKQEQFTLSGSQGKENVLLCFWTTWCPYCRKELQHLSDQYNVLTKAGIRVIAIDIGEQAYKVENFLEKSKITLSVYLDKEGAIADKYDVRGVPTFIIVNKSGKISLRANSLPERFQEYIE